MRILIVLLSVNLFGTERHAIELANGLAEAGHAVGLVLRARPRDAARQAGYAALTALIDRRVTVFPAGRRLPLLGLARAVRRFRPDVMHAHYERSARWAARLPFRPPLLASNHYGWRRDYAGCDGLICLTAAQRAAVPASFRGKVFHIGNWVLPHAPPDAARVAALRRGLGLTPDDFVFGSVARLEPDKGFDCVIDAFLRADLPGARLVIVGNGGEEARLRAMAAPAGDRIIFAGFRADVRELYHAFDAFVLGSIVEQFVLVVMEALEAGLPVIATATDGVREIAARAPLLMVPVGDTAALAVALRRARDGLLAKPPSEAATAFRRDAVLPLIEAAYRAVIAARRRAATS